MKVQISVVFEVDKKDDEPEPIAYELWIKKTLDKWAAAMPDDVLRLFGARSIRMITPFPEPHEKARQRAARRKNQ